MTRRVIISGIGIVSPLGADRESSWQALRAGTRAVRHLEIPASDGTIRSLGAPARLADELLPEPAELTAVGRASEAVALTRTRRPDIGWQRTPSAAESEISAGTMDAPLGWAGDVGDRPDRQLSLAERAAVEAMTHAGLGEGADCNDLGPRAGCTIGNSKGNLDALAGAFEQLEQTGLVDPRLWLGFLPGTMAGRLAGKFNLLGPCSCPVAACATGLLAVIEAAQWIADDRCDLVLAGSADASLVPMLLGSYQRMGVLAPADDPAPAAAVRPFSRNRQGFAVGEGAAMLVLEEAGHAQRRGGRPIAEIAGWAAGGDAQTMTTLPESPEALVRTIAQALRRAEIDAQTIGHVNCHGTATSTNDPWETRAIHNAFGGHAQRLHLTANKSMVGHLLGAAGSVELAMTALALRDQFVPPTMNLQEPDPLCDLDYTPDLGLPTGFEAALKLSFGFGGHTAAVVLRRPR